MRKVPRTLRIIAIAISLPIMASGAFSTNTWALTVEETQKLLASDGAGSDMFGQGISISGNTALIGARLDDDNGNNSGSVYVFTRDASGTWTQQAKLLAADGAAFDFFGGTVSVSGDTALVGADRHDDNGDNSGAAYVFTRDASGNWTHQAKLLASDGVSLDAFGSSVSLSGDTALIGAQGVNTAVGSNVGAVYVFTRDAGGNWTEQQKLLAVDGSANQLFGDSVAQSDDTALIGAPNPTPGAAYVFTRDAGGTWTQQAKLMATDATRRFGGSVSLFGDTALIGANLDSETATSAGAAYVFTRDNTGTWAQQAKLRASNGAVGDNFGTSVAVFEDTALVGADKECDGIGCRVGEAYVFTHDGIGNWTEDAILSASDGIANNVFGSSVFILDSTIFVGARFDNDNGPVSGSVYVYRILADADGDGITDDVDGQFDGVFTDESNIVSDDATDQHLSGTSFLTIQDRADLDVRVSDAANPAGLNVTADGGGVGTAAIAGCGIAMADVALTDGDSAVITCSSLTMEVIAGPIEIMLDGSVVTVPANGIVRIAELGGGIFEVTNVGPELIEIDDGGATIPVGTGDTQTVNDKDGDGTADSIDNCPTVSNADQTDVNGDSYGDACVDPTAVFEPGTFGANPIVAAGVEIERGTTFGDDAYVGENAIVDKNVFAGDDVSVGAYAMIEQASVIGDDVIIGPNVLIKRAVVIGDNVSVGITCAPPVVAGDPPCTVVNRESILEGNNDIGSNVSLGREVTVIDGSCVTDGETYERNETITTPCP